MQCKCGSELDVREVNFRAPGVNKFYAAVEPLCKACRTHQRGQWAYAKKRVVSYER